MYRSIRRVVIVLEPLGRLTHRRQRGIVVRRRTTAPPSHFSCRRRPLLSKVLLIVRYAAGKFLTIYHHLPTLTKPYKAPSLFRTVAQLRPTGHSTKYNSQSRTSLQHTPCCGGVSCEPQLFMCGPMRRPQLQHISQLQHGMVASVNTAVFVRSMVIAIANNPPNGKRKQLVKMVVSLPSNSACFSSGCNGDDVSLIRFCGFSSACTACTCISHFGSIC